MQVTKSRNIQPDTTPPRRRPVADHNKDSNVDPSSGAMRGLDCTPLEQALVNTRAAMRAAGMVPRVASDLIPHPNDLLMAELRNVERYLTIALKK